MTTGCGGRFAVPQGYDLDARLLLRQTVSTRADHRTARRSSGAYLHSLLRVDVDAMRERPLRQRVMLFDDFLTSGKHFKRCQRRLRELDAKVPVCGVFFARRVQSSRWCCAGNFASGQGQ